MLQCRRKLRLLFAHVSKIFMQQKLMEKDNARGPECNKKLRLLFAFYNCDRHFSSICKQNHVQLSIEYLCRFSKFVKTIKTISIPKKISLSLHIFINFSFLQCYFWPNPTQLDLNPSYINSIRVELRLHVSG